MATTTTHEDGSVTGRWPLAPHLPTLVFISGAALNAALWEAQIAPLAEHFNTLALELPGHGTHGGCGRQDIREYARVVMDRIQALAAPQPIPCGLSMGGAIAQELLISFPTAFKAGILINTGARLRVMPMIFETLRQGFDAYLDMIMAVAVSGRSDAGTIRGRLQTCLVDRVDVAIGDFKACDGFDAMDRLDRIEVPVLVLTAVDDVITPPKFGVFLKDHIPGAQSVSIAGAGHLAPMERPGEVNEAIREFVQGIAA